MTTTLLHVKVFRSAERFTCELADVKRFGKYARRGASTVVWFTFDMSRQTEKVQTLIRLRLGRIWARTFVAGNQLLLLHRL